MAPPRTVAAGTTPAAVAAAQQRSQTKKSNRAENFVMRYYKKYVNYEYVKFLIFDPAALPIVSVIILLAELVLNVLVINRVPYTEIDWVAYMQECEGFLNGTTNYALLKGDTGPLVYPAAFVYIYSALYFITAHGRNVRLAQYIFAVIYLLQMWLVLRLYTKSRKVPPYVLALSVFTSYRIHSIYVLRLFNDPLAVLFLYAALNLFLDRHWTWGSVCFSLGVGIKMNILLFAPSLLLFYLVNLGYLQTFLQLAVCGTLQLLLGAPFLLTHPLEYLKGSFDLGRVFEHQWTVNYRFLTRPIFEHKVFHLSLLVLHLLLLCACARPTYVFFKNYSRLRGLQMQLQPQITRKNEEIKKSPTKKPKRCATTQKSGAHEDTNDFTPDQTAFIKSFERGLQKSSGLKAPSAASTKEELRQDTDDAPVSIHFDQCTQLALLPFFLCNFIGVLCSRSLHYQFYVWYFHSLPHLAWSTSYSLPLRYLILGLIEFCWNSYPSTYFSSAMLHVCHLVLFVGVLRTMMQTTQQSAATGSQQAHKEAAASTTENGKLKTN